MSEAMTDEELRLAFGELRGEKITLSPDGKDIPCREESDAQKLCKRPVVSVLMITYNHEPYLRRAIEGVMMQKTDFAFELVLGEDCSRDKTRDICFEYQKKFPDRIRVLWWDENVNKIGGNARRTAAHCRGEFVAICEEDDYWTDPLKLQKQVDVFRSNPSVGICFCRAAITKVDSEELADVWDASAFEPGVIRSADAFATHCFGRAGARVPGGEYFLMTQTVMLRKSVWDAARKRFEILRWNLSLADTPTWLAVMASSDAYYLPDVVAVYRTAHGGALLGSGHRVIRDATLARCYYTMKQYGLTFEEARRIWRCQLTNGLVNYVKRYNRSLQQEWYRMHHKQVAALFNYGPTLLFRPLLWMGILNRSTAAIPIRLVGRCVNHDAMREQVR